MNRISRSLFCPSRPGHGEPSGIWNRCFCTKAIPSSTARTGRERIAAGELPDRGEGLGSGSEVESFGVEARHGLLVEAFATREAPELLDQLGAAAAPGAVTLERLNTALRQLGESPLPGMEFRPLQVA